MSTEMKWPFKALEAREKVLESIPKELRLDSDHWQAKYPPGSDVRPIAEECGLLSPLDLEITSFDNDATELLKAIADKKWTAVEVTRAFLKRACIAHQVVGCLTGILFDEAIARAQELDDYLEKNGKVIGPLHGLPHSAKECCAIAGHRSTGGILSRLSEPVDTSNAHLIQALIDAGAIFFCKTNLPQGMMTVECHSFWGETKNPVNTDLAPGGSSGGCAALMAFGGSPISVGGDIGGSLRVPAGSCGLYTLKATSGRVPGPCTFDTMPGNNGMAGTAGPITRSKRDIQLWFSTILSKAPWTKNNSLLPMEWRSLKTPEVLKIGIMTTDGVVEAFPPIQRAIIEVKRALQNDTRFEVKEFRPFKHEYGVKLAHRLYFPDGGKTMRKSHTDGGEPILPLTEWVLTIPGVKELTMVEYWNLIVERETYRAAYWNHFKSQDVDVVICPVSQAPATELGTARYWGYTCIWNLLDYPAAVFPTGFRSTRTVEDVQVQSQTTNADYPVPKYQASVYENAPLCLQLVGGRFKDEEVMQAMELIKGSLEQSFLH